jgi:hypothetical protein
VTVVALLGVSDLGGNSLLPCWVQTPPLRVKTHADPVYELSPYPPTMAVLQSADSARIGLARKLQPRCCAADKLRPPLRELRQRELR